VTTTKETTMAGMRSVLNLDISLGLFGFPVKVYKATNDPNEGVQFRQLHGECKTPINLVKRCKTCNVDVAQDELLKGYELAPGNFLAFTEAEIKALKPEKAGMLKVDGYLTADEIDPAYHNGSVYFLAPGGKDPTTFTTFRDALGDRWAVGKVVLYGREQVVAIRAVEHVLSMHVVRAHNEIRSPLDVPSYDKIPGSSKADHVQLMEQLMNQSALRLDDVAFDSDSYADAVKALIEARKAGQPNPSPTETAPVTQASDLVAMLKASLAAAKQPAA
jgi:DNA end-binding protein Ku